MADRRACICRGERRAARVSEQVEHIDRAVCAADHAVDEIPVGGLLGEQAGVLKAHGFELEGQVAIVDGPLRGQLVDFPLAAARPGAVVDRVRLVPRAAGSCARPDGLRVRAHQHLFAPALHLFAAAAVQNGVVLPVVRNPHKLILRSLGLHNISAFILTPNRAQRNLKSALSRQRFSCKTAKRKDAPGRILPQIPYIK